MIDKIFLFLSVVGNGRVKGTGLPHPLGVLIGYLIAEKDEFGSTAWDAG